jgi:4-hydroxyphenylpyruvate dioxygenase-like putative hemolysin
MTIFFSQPSELYKFLLEMDGAGVPNMALQTDRLTATAELER